MLKKMLSVVVASAAAVTMTACNERQVATGAAVVGGALIGGAIANNYNRNRGYYYNDGYGRGGYYRRGYGYGDGYYGRGYGPRRGYWNGLNQTSMDSTDAAEATVELAANAPAAISPQQALAKQYGMPTRAAAKVLNAFETVKTSGSLDSLVAMGVSQNELQAIANGAEPEVATVTQVAASIGASTDSVKGLFNDFAREYAAAQADNRL